MVPGPGVYDVDKAMAYMYPALAKSISAVVPETHQGIPADVPGPGAYNPKPLDKIKGPKIMQQTTTAIKPIEKEKKIKQKRSDSPPSKSRIENEDRSTFGKAQRGELAQKTFTPGPDAYQRIETDWRKKRDAAAMGKETCTFGMKTMRFFQANNNPGPGTYSGEAYPNGPYFSVGKGPRSGQENLVYTDKYYDAPNIFSAPKIGFGNEKKQTETKKSKYPGPGTYNIPNTVGEIPAYLLKAESS